MAWKDDYTVRNIASSTDNASTVTHTVSGYGVAAGHLILARAILAAQTLSSVADSKNNQWVRLAEQTPVGTSGYTALWGCLVANALAVGDTITFTNSAKDNCFTSSDEFVNVFPYVLSESKAINQMQVSGSLMPRLPGSLVYAMVSGRFSGSPSADTSVGEVAWQNLSSGFNGTAGGRCAVKRYATVSPLSYSSRPRSIPDVAYGGVHLVELLTTGCFLCTSPYYQLFARSRVRL